jgi:hypothetical protein
MKEEKPELILQKNAEQGTNKIRLPKSVITLWGRNYYMEIYEDKIVLKPMKKGK